MSSLFKIHISTLISNHLLFPLLYLIILRPEFLSFHFQFQNPDNEPEEFNEFVFTFLRTRYGTDPLAFEWGYNLHDACSRYSHDPAIGLFNGVISGQVEYCNAIYYSMKGFQGGSMVFVFNSIEEIVFLVSIDADHHDHFHRIKRLVIIN